VIEKADKTLYAPNEIEIIKPEDVLSPTGRVSQVATGVTLEFEENFEPPHDTGVSYWGEALAELIGAYVRGQRIAVPAWVKHWDFPEHALEEFWNRLIEKLYEELTSRIPDLKWFNLEIYFLDTMDPVERAAFLSQDFP
jgi:hypothetical protein